MPKKTLLPRDVPIAIQNHIEMWGQAIKCQRIKQRMTAAQLAEIISMSTPTISRIEKGDPGVNVCGYFQALSTVGLLDTAAPKLKASLWQNQRKQRMRPSFDEWAEPWSETETDPWPASNHYS